MIVRPIPFIRGTKKNSYEDRGGPKDATSSSAVVVVVVVVFVEYLTLENGEVCRSKLTWYQRTDRWVDQRTNGWTSYRDRLTKNTIWSGQNDYILA